MNSLLESKDYILNRTANFLDSNNIYNEYEVQYILGCIKNISFPEIYSTEMVREILDELDLIPKKYNIYDDYIDFINSIHNISEKNILEVGGGAIPRLGERIKLHQSKGTITVYDPRLYKTQEEGKLKLKKSKVTEFNDVSDIDLIIGLMPCKGAEDLLQLALKNKIDFIVWLCEGGPHGDCYDFFEDENEWRDCLISTAEDGIKKQNMGKLKIKSIPKYSYKYPIIYNDRN